MFCPKLILHTSQVVGRGALVEHVVLVVVVVVVTVTEFTATLLAVVVTDVVAVLVTGDAIEVDVQAATGTSGQLLLTHATISIVFYSYPYHSVIQA